MNRQAILITTHPLMLVSLHLLLSLLISLIATRLLPRRYRQPYWPVYGFFLVFALFIPLLSLAGIATIILVTRLLPERRDAHPFIETPSPQFTQSHAGIRHPLGEGALRTRLNNTNLPLDMRMNALLSVQTLSRRNAVPILKELLGDSADDLRLLAYGMLDNREKDINANIHALTEKLTSSLDDALRHIYQKQLAELYWAFSYEQLAEGDVLAYMLAQAENHARAALALRSDGDMWVLLAQILIKQEKLEQARDAFEQALVLDVPATRIHPYLAELAFLRQDYAAVKQHLHAVPASNQIPGLARIQRFWLTEGHS